MSAEKMVPQLAQGERLASTQSLVQNMELLAMALGPVFAMLAAAVLGKVWLLVAASMVFLLAGLVGIAYFNVFNRTRRVKVIPREHLVKVMRPPSTSRYCSARWARCRCRR